MSFANKYRGKELTVMVKLISIFGVVEVRQMRELFSHLNPKTYGKIMNRLHMEGMVFTTPDAKYLASNRLSTDKIDIESSVSCFWALISIKDSIMDFCAGEMPALLTVSAANYDYDLIPVNEKALTLINDSAFELPESVRRLLIVRSINDANMVERRMKNDFLLVTGKDGVTGSYEL